MDNKETGSQNGGIAASAEESASPAAVEGDQQASPVVHAESGVQAESGVHAESGAQGESAESVETAPIPEVPGDISIAVGVPRLLAPAFTAKNSPGSEHGSPSGVFLALVAAISLFLDLSTKLWAEKKLEGYPGYMDVLEGHLSFVLAKNKGGAWGLMQGASEHLRRPFFLLVSVAAIWFIVTLYRRLHPRQHALRWGLPLVLGGALGNVVDRVRYGHVIDFIDYRAEWVKTMNEWVAKRSASHLVTDHWPTFNIADVAICIGVGLMAVDMFTSRRGKEELLVKPLPGGELKFDAPAEAPSASAAHGAAATSTEEPALLSASESANPGEPATIKAS